MPYKRQEKWIGQVRKNGYRRERKFQTKKDALAWESKMRRKPVARWEEQTRTTCLVDWANAYLAVSKTRFTSKTYKEKCRTFRLLFRMVDPALPVSRLTPGMVLSFILEQKKARSGYSANKDRKNLVAGWNWGMKYLDPVLPSPNPCLVDPMPEVRQPRYVPPEEDFWKIYDLTEGQDRLMLLTFLHLGARRGEIFRLQWSDVDFQNRRIRLWTRKRKDGAMEYDWLPLTNELRDMLRWWWENRPVKESPFVFVSLDETAFAIQYFGKPFTVRQKFMHRLCETAGVKHFGFHAIRHLTASTLFNKGYDVGIIQAVLRHKSPTTTERYLRSIGLERVREALEDIRRDDGAEIVPFGDISNRQRKNEK